MRHLTTYKLFESIPIYYHPKDKILNNEIVDYISDILIDLDDEGVRCRMWVNNPGGTRTRSRSVVRDILLEIDHSGKNEDLVNDIINRVKVYIDQIGWKLDTTHTGKEFNEYRITPISY